MVIKIVHHIALSISRLAYTLVRLGDHLWEIGGRLEAWCDERHWAAYEKHQERERRARVAQWQRWVDEYAGKDVTKELNDAR